MTRLPLLRTQEGANTQTLYLTKPEILPTSLKDADLYLLCTNSYKYTQTVISTYTNSYHHIHKKLSTHTQTAINIRIAIKIHTRSYHQKQEELSTYKQLSTHTYSYQHTNSYQRTHRKLLRQKYPSPHT
jgi:hypothetical protein